MFEKKILQCLNNFPDNVWPKYVVSPKSREVSTNDGIITQNSFNAAVPTSSETK